MWSVSNLRDLLAALWPQHQRSRNPSVGKHYCKITASQPPSHTPWGSPAARRPAELVANSVSPPPLALFPRLFWAKATISSELWDFDEESLHPGEAGTQPAAPHCPAAGCLEPCLVSRMLPPGPGALRSITGVLPFLPHLLLIFGASVEELAGEVHYGKPRQPLQHNMVIPS